MSEIERLRILREATPSALLADTSGVENHLKSILSKDITSFDLNESWEFADALRRILLLLGDDSYILARLQNETHDKAGAGQGSLLKWKEILDEDKLKTLRDAYEPGLGQADRDNRVRRDAVESLSLIYTARSHYGRTQRAVTDLKALYLHRLRTTLTLLLVLFL